MWSEDGCVFFIIRTTIIILMLLLGLKAPVARVIKWNLQGWITYVDFCVLSLYFLRGICIFKIVLIQFYGLYQGSLTPDLLPGTRLRSVWNWVTQVAGEHVSTHSSISVSGKCTCVLLIQMELHLPAACKEPFLLLRCCHPHWSAKLERLGTAGLYVDPAYDARISSYFWSNGCTLACAALNSHKSVQERKNGLEWRWINIEIIAY